MPKINITEYEFLKTKITLNEHECWIWAGSLTTDGYGRFKWKHKNFRAHRRSYELHHNIYLNESQVLHHKCRNTSCVNPNHLQVTTFECNQAIRWSDEKSFRKQNPHIVEALKSARKVYAKAYKEWQIKRGTLDSGSP